MSRARGILAHGKITQLHVSEVDPQRPLPEAGGWHPRGPAVGSVLRSRRARRGEDLVGLACRPSSNSPRPALPPQAGAPTLEQRIPAAVRAADLASANAVVKEIGGRRKDVYAAVNAMIADHRLRMVGGFLRARK